MFYKRQMNHDTSQLTYISEGRVACININMSNTGRRTIADRTTVTVQVPYDTRVHKWSFTAFIDNPANPGVNDIIPTSLVKVMIGDSLAQGPWITTSGGNLSEADPVPANLLFGRYPTEFEPRTLIQNTELEFVIEPQGFTLLDFKLTILGYRMDMLPPWERDALCDEDPRTRGAHWLFFDPLTLARADSATAPLAPGPEVIGNLKIPSVPFDVAVTSWSGFATAAAPNDTRPIARAWYDFKFYDQNDKRLLSEGYTPSTILGGATMASSAVPPLAAIPLDTEQLVDYVPRSTPLNTAFLVRNTKTIQFLARAIYSPLDVELFPTMSTQMMLHGMRVPPTVVSVGYPYANREDGTLRCPPNNDGPHGISGYNQPQYGMPPSPHQSPYQQSPYQQPHPQQQAYQQAYQQPYQQPQYPIPPQPSPYPPNPYGR